MDKITAGSQRTQRVHRDFYALTKQFLFWGLTFLRPFRAQTLNLLIPEWRAKRAYPGYFLSRFQPEGSWQSAIPVKSLVIRNYSEGRRNPRFLSVKAAEINRQAAKNAKERKNRKLARSLASSFHCLAVLVSWRFSSSFGLCPVRSPRNYWTGISTTTSAALILSLPMNFIFLISSMARGASSRVSLPWPFHMPISMPTRK